ncbi:MAG: dTDP-4-dehydrorhamnose 3,5-epimerase [Chloroflexi bacterium]|nr:dTDP-4-dehydrorhamnose 3,5-epimerase [Chloroflexota bacterium]
MIFHPTTIDGAVLVDLDQRGDERGFFARAWCQNEFEEQGLTARLVQVNLSQSRHAGTLRGMHFQRAPHEEAKLVRCIRGSLFDVVADMRPGSRTEGHWFGATLTSQNRRMLYVPEGCAHGFLTLEDDTEALYQVSEFYTPDAESGFRWDDPAFDIRWPRTPAVISQKDEVWAPLAGEWAALAGSMAR